MLYSLLCVYTSLLINVLCHTVADSTLSQDQDEQNFRNIFNTFEDTDDFNPSENAKAAVQGVMGLLEVMTGSFSQDDQRRPQG